MQCALHVFQKCMLQLAWQRLAWPGLAWLGLAWHTMQRYRHKVPQLLLPRASTLQGSPKQKRCAQAFLRPLLSLLQSLTSHPLHTCPSLP
ncbi:hypothetical protein V8C86DRAFT_2898571 [Haematococcus lacustris]